MENKSAAKKGTLKVSENVIAAIVKNTALEISGVDRIPPKPVSVKSLFRSSPDPSDIRVTMSEGMCEIGLSVIIKCGSEAVAVCSQIQEKVKAAVQSMTGVPVSKVDVSVSDVSFAE